MVRAQQAALGSAGSPSTGDSSRVPARESASSDSSVSFDTSLDRPALDATASAKRAAARDSRRRRARRPLRRLLLQRQQWSDRARNAAPEAQELRTPTPARPQPRTSREAAISSVVSRRCLATSF